MTLTEFWHWLISSRYTRFLEAENLALKCRIVQYENILIPGLRTTSFRERVAPRQDASTNSAQPSPATQPIPERQPLRLKRTSWQEAKAELEYKSDLTGARLEKAALAHAQI